MDGILIIGIGDILHLKVMKIVNKDIWFLQ